MISRVIRDQNSRAVANNLAFTFAFFALSGVVGSASSILFTAAGVWAIVSLAEGRYSLKSERDWQIVGAATAVYYLSGAVATVIHWGDAETLTQLFERMPFLFLLPLVSRFSIGPSPVLLVAARHGAAVGLLAGFLIASHQWVNGNLRPSAFSGNPNVFAITTVILMVVVLSGIQFCKKNWKIVFWISVTMGLVSCFLSGSKAGTGIAVFVFLFGLFCESRLITPRYIFLTLFAFGLVGVVLTNVTSMDARVSQMIDQLMAEDPSELTSTGARIAMWQCGIESWKKRPIVGAGHDNSLYEMKRCGRKQFKTRLGLSHFHNFIINALAKGGLIELFSVIAMLVTPLWFLLRRRRQNSANQDASQSGLVLYSLLLFVVTTNGLVNILFGHDVHDAMFLYVTILALVANADPGSQHVRMD